NFRRAFLPDFRKCLPKPLARHTSNILVHPPGFRSAIRFVVVVGGDVVPVLVKGDFTVVISHVNFELPRRAPPLPPVVGVPHSEITLGRRITDSARRHKLHPQEAKEQSSEMSENRNSTLRWLKNRNDRDHDPNADPILGLDP